MNLLGRLVRIPVLMHGGPPFLEIRTAAIGLFYLPAPSPDNPDECQLRFGPVTYRVQMKLDELLALARETDDTNTY